MALNIKDPETDRLARDVAAATGESITRAVHSALQEKLERLRASKDATFFDDIDRITQRAAQLPVLDARTDEQIIGYDEHGLPS